MRQKKAKPRHSIRWGDSTETVAPWRKIVSDR